MKRYLITIVIACASCTAPRGGAASAPATQYPAMQPAAAGEISERDWVGIYASTSEIGGFAGTVLVLDKRRNYRLRSYSDVSFPNGTTHDEQRGDLFIEGRTIYLAESSGSAQAGQPQRLDSITRYTLVEINGRKVLMRNDALKVFREENKLYDYGILVKVKDDARLLLDLGEVEHPSVKVLYVDPAKPWKDPFVHGPNSR